LDLPLISWYGRVPAIRHWRGGWVAMVSARGRAC
jgi:hypothetical protein